MERIFEFVAERDSARAQQTVQRLREAVMLLERHPLIGRPVEDGRRELVIAHGRGTYLAPYRWFPADQSALVLAARHACEAGYDGDVS